MRVLVVATPRFQIPPEQLPGVIEAAMAWQERHQDRIETLGLFVGGGGFGIVNAPDETSLNQIMIELPFTWFSEMQVRPFVDGATGWRQLQEAAAVMAGARA